MPNQQASTWKSLPSRKSKTEPRNKIKELLCANMKRRNAVEEEQDVEMNGWNGYANLDLNSVRSKNTEPVALYRGKGLGIGACGGRAGVEPVYDAPQASEKRMV